MAMKKIRELTAAASLAGSDLMEIETSGSASRKATLEVLQDLLLPPGFIADFGNVAVPAGWIECDGAAVSRSTYARLFAAVGEVWGAGNGTTTFNVPDFRGVYRRGAGSHGSETMADGNPFAGPAVGAFEDDQMQGHVHEVGYDTGASTSGDAGINGSASLPDLAQDSDVPKTDGVNGTPRAGDETRPFAAGVLVCIKA